MLCVVLEIVPLRGWKIPSHAHKTGSWYFVQVLFKVSHGHPLPSIWESSLPCRPPPLRPLRALESLARQNKKVKTDCYEGIEATHHPDKSELEDTNYLITSSKLTFPCTVFEDDEETRPHGISK